MQPKKLPAAAPLAAALALVLSSAPAFAADPTLDAEKRKPTDLDQVKVIGNGLPESSSSKHTQPLLDTPQSITVVPAELMQEQGVTTLRDALRNVPGISMQAGEGGVPAGDNLSLRGFNARTDLFVDGIRDFGGYSRDPFNLEQIEVVKGPASTHSGRGSTGGSINLASKAARVGEFSRGTLSVGDDGLVRATADINQPLSDSSAFRINLLGHSSEVNGRDAVENKRWGVAPSLSFGLGSDTVTSINLFHLEQDNIPDYGQPWVPATNNALPLSRDSIAPVDRSNFYGLLDRDYEKTETDMGTVTVQHTFNDDVSLRNATRVGRSTRDSIITAPRFAANNSTNINRTVKTRDSEDTIAANVTDVTARFQTGVVAHTLVAGLELAREESTNRARAEITPPFSVADLFDPDFNASYTGTISPSGRAEADADSAAIYVFDTLELNRQWELSGGLRWDYFAVDYTNHHFDTGVVDRLSSTDTMLSGRVGVVFKPRENGSIYFGYGTSFNPSAEGLTLSESVGELDPEESRTAELGTKWNLFNEKLALTTAVFRTEKTNARTTDQVTGLVTLSGRQRVDGFEIGLAGRITEHWTMSGGYAFLDGQVLESTDSRENGKELGNTPRNTVTLWTTYELTDSFEVGFGTQHVGARWTNNREERQAKSYTLYDAMLGYRFNPKFALRLNGYNLSNKAYVDRVGGGHYLPGAERTLALSADFSF